MKKLQVFIMILNEKMIYLEKQYICRGRNEGSISHKDKKQLYLIHCNKIIIFQFKTIGNKYGIFYN